MKGWHKHGVCSRPHWTYDRKLEKQDSKLFSGLFVFPLIIAAVVIVSLIALFLYHYSYQRGML